MINWTYLLCLYLGVCGLIAIYWISLAAKDDIRMYREPWRKATSKFGYNYKNPLMYVLLLFFACPGLNLITLVFAWYSRNIKG